MTPPQAPDAEIIQVLLQAGAHAGLRRLAVAGRTRIGCEALPLAGFSRAWSRQTAGQVMRFMLVP